MTSRVKLNTQKTDAGLAAPTVMGDINLVKEELRLSRPLYLPTHTLLSLIYTSRDDFSRSVIFL